MAPNNLDGDQSTDIDNEIAETSLIAIENLILKCQSDASQHLKTIYETTSCCLLYDPNYTYKDDDEDQDMGNDEQEDWGSDFYDDEQDDDDDTAWKVRKSAIKVIDAIIVSCPVQLKEYWSKFVKLLSGRFIERDDNVKCDILETFQNLMKASIKIDDSTNQGFDLALIKTRSYRDTIDDFYPDIVANLIKQYQNKNLRVKVAIMKTFSILVMLMPQDKLEQHLSKIIDEIVKSASEGNNDLFTHSLSILKTSFRNNDPGHTSQTAQKDSAKISKFLDDALQNGQQRIVSEALRVIGQFVVQLQDISGNLDQNHGPSVKSLYAGTLNKLKRNDIDQEVKYSSIIAMAQIIRISHKIFNQQEINEVVKLYGERLQLELTREPTLKAFKIIARNEASNINLQGLQNITPELIKLLHQASRQTHLWTLDAILALIEKYPAQFQGQEAKLQDEVTKFISQNDIQRSSLAIQCSKQLIIMNSSKQQNIQAIQKSVEFAGSNQIQGQEVVDYLQQLFAVACNAELVNQQDLESLIQQSSLKTRTSARIAAFVIVNQKQSAYITQLYNQISNAKDDQERVKATLCIGEIGIFQDLSGIANIIQTIQSLFQNPNDQIRSAAAIALGGISIGNTSFFLDKVFQLISTSASQEKYMFLSTIKEIIVNKPECLKAYIKTLMELYYNQSNNDDEPIRNIVAESIGKLFVTHPMDIQNPLNQGLSSKDVKTVSTYVRSFKYSAHNNNSPASFQPFIKGLIELVGHSDLAVKKNALQSLSQIVYNNSLKILLSQNVEELAQIALLETPIKKELIVTVDLGPFKHTVDNGSQIRKASFGLLENMVEQYSFNQSQVVDAVITSVQDSNEDVQVLCLNFMVKLINICPMIVIGKLDTLVEKFQYIYQKNCNNLKKDGEAERALNLMRGILRVCDGLLRNSETTANIVFNQWFNQYVMENNDVPAMRELYEKIASTSNQILF